MSVCLKHAVNTQGTEINHFQIRFADTSIDIIRSTDFQPYLPTNESTTLQAKSVFLCISKAVTQIWVKFDMMAIAIRKSSFPVLYVLKLTDYKHHITDVPLVITYIYKT